MEGVLGVEEGTKGRECGRGELRAKNSTGAPPYDSQGLRRETGRDLSMSGDRGKDAGSMGSLGPRGQKKPSGWMQAAVQYTASKGAKEPWALFQRQPYLRGSWVREALEAAGGVQVIFKVKWGPACSCDTLCWLSQK